MLLHFKQAEINPLTFQPDNAANFLKQMAEGAVSKDIPAGEKGKTVLVTSTSSTGSVLVMFKIKENGKLEQVFLRMLQVSK